MVSKADSNKARLRRHRRVRGKISGTAERPRLNVFRSLNHIYAQIIDDVKGVTLVSASSVEKDFGMAGGNKEAAKKVGEAYCETRRRQRASPRSFLTAAATSTTAAFKELAEGAREGGLKF